MTGIILQFPEPLPLWNLVLGSDLQLREPVLLNQRKFS